MDTASHNLRLMRRLGIEYNAQRSAKVGNALDWKRREVLRPRNDIACHDRHPGSLSFANADRVAFRTRGANEDDVAPKSG